MISVTSSTIYIDGENCSFEDVYKEVAASSYYYKAKKIGDRSYYFDFNFYIGKNIPASLSDENVSVEVTSSYFQIYENSSFRLGNKTNDKVLNGCYFYAPNLVLGYGFGCKDKEDIYTMSGNLYLYGSYIEAPCFWGFFNNPDKQIVEIEDCLIKGFGRISGYNSYVKNATYLSVDSKYGSISVLGKVRYLQNISVNNVLDDGYALYFNPEISGDCVIENFKAFNYTNLIYCESFSEKKTFSLVNAKIKELVVYFEDYNSTIELKNRIYFKSLDNSIVIKIYYQDTLVDTMALGDRNYTDLLYISKTKSGENKFDAYTVLINDKYKINITPDVSFTIDVDAYINETSVGITNENIYLIPDKTATLGNIFSFFVCSNSISEIELRKSNNNKIADPYEVTKINDSMYRVSFLIGELAEESSTGEIWQDGIYLLYCNVDGKNFWESMKIIRDEEENEDDNPPSDDTQVIIDNNETSGAKIYM